VEGRALYAAPPLGDLRPRFARASEIGIALVSDQAMVEPALLLARLAAAAGQPTWEFRFSYVASSLRTDAPGALHAGLRPSRPDEPLPDRL
jgi:carboxylesterase type B